MDFSILSVSVNVPAKLWRANTNASKRISLRSQTIHGEEAYKKRNLYEVFLDTFPDSGEKTENSRFRIFGTTSLREISSQSDHEEWVENRSQATQTWLKIIFLDVFRTTIGTFNTMTLKRFDSKSFSNVWKRYSVIYPLTQWNYYVFFIEFEMELSNKTRSESKIETWIIIEKMLIIIVGRVTHKQKC